MEDPRITIRLLQYWQMIRKNELFPSIEQFNSAVIGDLWQQCFLVSVDTHAAQNQKFKYEYMGPFIIAAYGKDLTGVTINSEASKKFPGKMALKKMDEVVSEYRPMEDSGYFVNEAGKLIKYRACFLPFGTKQGGLTHIMSGFSYREF